MLKTRMSAKPFDFLGGLYGTGLIRLDEVALLAGCSPLEAFKLLARVCQAGPGHQGRTTTYLIRLNKIARRHRLKVVAEVYAVARPLIPKNRMHRAHANASKPYRRHARLAIPAMRRTQRVLV